MRGSTNLRLGKKPRGGKQISKAQLSKYLKAL